jgi:hypothetical protein
LDRSSGGTDGLKDVLGFQVGEGGEALAFDHAGAELAEHRHDGYT